VRKKFLGPSKRRKSDIKVYLLLADCTNGPAYAAVLCLSSSVCLSVVCNVFLGKLASGKRLQCGPVLQHKDALKVNLKQCGINPSALGDDTQDRSAWRTLCHEAVTQFEDSQVEALEHKRAARKWAQPRSNLSAWPCDSCSRVCSSRIGLHAHQQTHRWQAIRRFRRRSPLLVCNVMYCG